MFDYNFTLRESIEVPSMMPALTLSKSRQVVLHNYQHEDFM